jgi:hypothetical protein
VLSDVLGVVATCRPIPTCHYRRYERMARALYRATKNYGLDLGTYAPPSEIGAP